MKKIKASKQEKIVVLLLYMLNKIITAYFLLNILINSIEVSEVKNQFISKNKIL
jgi:hypothetical protein